MAKEEKKEEFYTTQPTSQLDLERRLEDGYTPDSDVGGTVRSNPNPFGEDEYVGTDPIYQNYAEETHKPLAAEEGVEKDAEDAHKKMHEGEDEVDDAGLGGKASRAVVGVEERSDLGSRFSGLSPNGEASSSSSSSSGDSDSNELDSAKVDPSQEPDSAKVDPSQGPGLSPNVSSSAPPAPPK